MSAPTPTPTPGRTNPNLLHLTSCTALGIMIVFVLVMGKALLVPVIGALILAYILRSTVESTERIPFVSGCPRFLRTLMVGFCFIVVLLFLGALVSSTVSQIIASAPAYQEGFTVLVGRVADLLGWEESSVWDSLRSSTMDRVNLQAAFTSGFSSASSLVSTLFLIGLYTLFLAAERATFHDKLIRSFGSEMRAGELQLIIHDINQKIGSYLLTKTLINIGLAIVSYVIMVFMGVDHALVWAILIGLLNYIPYIGSLLGVIGPVFLCLVQYVSIPATLALFAMLTFAQIIFGNYIEPRVVGKRVDLSPFVILLSLSFWTIIWGASGAILAIPMMSILTTVFAAFEGTRFLAVLMSDGDGAHFE